MKQSFRYEILSVTDGLQVRITQKFWARAAGGVLWTIAFLFFSYLSYRHLGLGRTGIVVAFAGVLLSSLVCVIGLVIGLVITMNSFRSCTLWLRPDQRSLDVKTFVRRGTRSFPLSEVREFGIGVPGHTGIPTLKFEVGNEWVVLADHVGQGEVEQLLRTIESKGFKLPGNNGEVKNKS